eukprot:4688793-Pyramimonas_sp.AAC.1
MATTALLLGPNGAGAEEDHDDHEKLLSGTVLPVATQGSSSSLSPSSSSSSSAGSAAPAVR